MYLSPLVSYFILIARASCFVAYLRLHLPFCVEVCLQGEELFTFLLNGNAIRRSGEEKLLLLLWINHLFSSRSSFFLSSRSAFLFYYFPLNSNKLDNRDIALFTGRLSNFLLSPIFFIYSNYCCGLHPKIF